MLKISLSSSQTSYTYKILTQDNPVLFCLDFCMKVQYLLCKIQDIIYLVGRIVNVWKFCLLNVPLSLSCLLIGANLPTGVAVLQPVFLNLYNNWSNFPIFAVVTPIWLASHFLILEFPFWKSVIYSNWSHSLYLQIGVNSSYFQIHSNSITSVFIPVGVYFLSLTNCSKSHILPA